MRFIITLRFMKFCFQLFKRRNVQESTGEEEIVLNVSDGSVSSFRACSKSYSPNSEITILKAVFTC